MAVLETIRVKLGILITVLIAVALLSFIIDPTTLQSVSSSMSSKYGVGEIDGKSISYNDFQADVEKFTAINEIVSGSTVHNEQQQIAVRNAAWQSLLDKYLFVSRPAWMPTRLSPLFKNCSVISEGLRKTLEKPIVNP